MTERCRPEMDAGHETLRSQILTKLGVESRTAAATFAVRPGFA